MEQETLIERLQQLADDEMHSKLTEVEPERWNQVEKNILLQTLDHFWKEHLATLDALRAGHPPSQLRAKEADRRI